MRTNLYVDGFNLYYRAVKGTPYRWLDVKALCEAYFPQCEVNRIRYFTAKVSATAKDPGKPTRQEVYLRALRTLPHLTVHFGQFTTHVAKRRLAQPPHTIVEVVETREKGSDVNLATFLLADGFSGEYDAAVVLSNDSDLYEPVRLVQLRAGLQVMVLNPQVDRNKVARALMNAASGYRTIRKGALRASQFPAILSDSQGTFHRPASW